MRILIIEDEEKISEFLQEGLREEGFAVDLAPDGEEGHFMATTSDYDLIVLDLMIPKIDGLTLCRKLRSDKITTPIIMLTAKTGVKNKVSGLDAGADDYLTKPFAFEELLARIRAQLRKKDGLTDNKLVVDDLSLDLQTHEIKRAGKTLVFTTREIALLEYLMRNAGRVLSRSMIIEHVWDINYKTDTNVIDVFINHLRKKIDQDHPRKLIHTLHGRGYMLKGSP
ncbi:MAG: response regulator transcription factor [Candidatus Omnitrophica bacterium]|nr:response regulator transcription factor [Candidatus Omnitrophota bacterium]